jgi:uncharacterized protein YndB with AHSA1/START domain
MTDVTKPTRGHQHEILIDAPPEAVWAAITEADQLVAWFPLHAAVAPGPGGVVTYDWGGGLAGSNRIETWEPPRRLRTGWVEVMAPETAADEARRTIAVDWLLEGRGGRTALRLVHSGFSPRAEWDDEFNGTLWGWEYELRSLKHYLERHRGRPRRAFWARQPVEATAAAAWARLTGPGGLVARGSLDGLAEGDRYALTLSTGDRVEGRVVLHLPGTGFAGTAEGLNDGLFRLWCERLGGMEASVWVSTWDHPEAEVEGLRRRWEGALRDLFAPATTVASA